jgi:hypothetical protein
MLYLDFSETPKISSWAIPVELEYQRMMSVMFRLTRDSPVVC